MSDIRITATGDGSRHFNGGYQHKPRGNRKQGRGYRGQRHGQYTDRLPRSDTRHDDDVQMAGDRADSGPSVPRSRYNPYGSRHPRDNHHGGRGFGKDRSRGGVMSRLGLPVDGNSSRDGSDWHKVIIPHGNKLDKDFVLRSIASIACVPFNPVMYHIENNREAVFYVNGANEASAIEMASNRITAPTGFKMSVRVHRCGRPASWLTDDVVSKLKQCMSKRYDVAAMSLNLTDLANDEDLKREDIFISLCKSNVASKVLEIIEKHIPELKIIDLSKNSLNTLDHFAKIADKASKVQRVNLANNLIRAERELRFLCKLDLEELCLDGNPVCNSFADRNAYISAIRKHFPKVLKLDGHDLPPPITFDTEIPASLPPTKVSFFPSEPIRDIIRTFTDQYFKFYDSGNRHMLIDAYHEQAMFSLSRQRLWTGGKQPNVDDYGKKCRNLTRTKETVQRQSRLKMGRINIIALLSELPATLHDPLSFTYDVGFSSINMLTFTVHGLFKEITSKTDKDIIRRFSRTFVAVPNGPGIAITNEMLCVSNAPSETAQKYFKTVAVPALTMAAPALVPPDVKQNMVQMFSLWSLMNETFSAMCLEQNGWNYDVATANFTQLKQENKIPPEAFVR